MTESDTPMLQPPIDGVSRVDPLWTGARQQGARHRPRFPGSIRRDDTLTPEEPIMAVTLDPPRVRDEAWIGREIHRARALLIIAASHGQTVRYGELSPFGHRRWYARRVLGGVFDLCELNGEPDLTAILVPAGQQPDDAEEVHEVFSYWREVRLAPSSPRRSAAY